MYSARRWKASFLIPSPSSETRLPGPAPGLVERTEGEQVWEQIVAGYARDYFNRAYVERLLKYHREGRSDYSRHLWTLYIFSLWHKQFLGSAQSTPNDGDVETIRVNETWRDQKIESSL